MPTQLERRELAGKIRAIRAGLGLSAAEVARRSGLSAARLSRIETAKLVPQPDDILALAPVLELRPEVRNALIRQALSLAPRTARTRNSRLQPDGAAAILSGTRLLRSFNFDWFPSVLQTPTSIAHSFAMHPEIEQSLPEFVASKLEIQACIASRRVETLCLLDHSLLEKPVLDARAWREQLYTLAPRMRFFGVELGILPPGVLTQEKQQFDLGVFDDELAIVERASESAASNWDRSSVRRMVRQYDALVDNALWDGEAVSYIDEVIRRFELEIDLWQSTTSK